MNSYFEITTVGLHVIYGLNMDANFMPIGCNLPFDLWTYLLCIILMGRNFYSLLRKRERERERESTKGQNSWILGYHFEAKSAIIFLWVQLFGK